MADTAEKTGAKEWPNTIRTREELDAALEAGLKSGEASENVLEAAERVLKRLKNG